MGQDIAGATGESATGNTGGSTNLNATNQGAPFYTPNPYEALPDAYEQISLKNEMLLEEQGGNKNNQTVPVTGDKAYHLFFGIVSMTPVYQAPYGLDYEKMKVGLESLQKEREALRKESEDLLSKCGAYGCPPSITREINKIIKKIDVLNQDIEKLGKSIKGKEEWLTKLNSMTQEELAVEAERTTKVAEMAMLSHCAYEVNVGLKKETGWEKVNNDLITIANMDIENSGFHCELFYNKNTEKYVLSFRGTDNMNDIVDAWVEGALRGGDEQTQKAIRLVGQLKEAGISFEDLELTGHSLGGRLAAEAAIKYGLTAYTFNAADISVETKTIIAIEGHNANIINTVSANDILTEKAGLGNLQGGINEGTGMMIVQDGLKDRVKYPKVSYGTTEIIKENNEGHPMIYLRQSLEQRSQDIKNKINEQNK
jgi:thioesterase domain-containing protein